MNGGQIGILSVGAGDIKISFDASNPAEQIRSSRIVRDLLRRGYALLVEVDGAYQRVYEFREDRCEYVIADLDPVQAAKADEEETTKNVETTEEAGAGEAESAEASARGPGRGNRTDQPNRGKRKTISAAGVPGIAIARTSGG